MPLQLVSPDVIPIKMFDLDLFYLHTDHDIRETLRRLDNHHLALEGGAMSKGEFEAPGQVL